MGHGHSRDWPKVGRVAGYVSAAALLIAAIFFLLDATGALGSNDYHPNAGLSEVQREAGYWVAPFAYQRHILWDVISRDTLFPLAFLALIVISLAVRAVVDAARPELVRREWSRSEDPKR